ncbi:MAG: SRPBCC domain-containing protein [Gemmataceae bacterium]|nr:SRPBCC domain-containing protein [Gemmataceae bacterium]
MVLRFDGERTLPLPPAQLWPRLRDAAFLVRCIPEAEVLGQPTRDQAQCRVRPGFSFVRGHLDVTVTVLDSAEPASVRFSLFSKGVGSSAEVEAALTLLDHDGRTRVCWTAAIKSLGGLLKLTPSGLIRGAAQKVIDDIWHGVEARLAT